MRSAFLPSNIQLQRIKELAGREYILSEEDVRILIGLISNYFRTHLIGAGYPTIKIQAITTKFRDAGRRSAPWRPASARVPGRPQDGADGNRRPRWHFDPDHKFYASEIMATLVEIKYYLQTLSMLNAPPLPENTIQSSFTWLLGHIIEPGRYLDPIQLIPIDLSMFVADPPSIQSGHFIPLDRGGRHVPDNAFLMLARSNQLQGNLTVEELIKLMSEIVHRHNTKSR
jgi:hypothetical protein